MLGPLLLLLGTAAFYLAWLGAAGLYDPNGGRYAETPREEEAEFAELWRGAGRVYLLTDSPSRIAKLQALGRLPVVLGRSGKNWLSSKRARPAG